MVKYKVRIVSKTGTVVPELQVLHLIFFFLRNQNLMYNLCIPQIVVPTHMAFFFQINEQIETNHPCHERNWTRRRLCSTKRRACLTRARMTLPEVQYESGGTTRRTDAEKYAERSPTQWEPKVQRTCSLFMQVKVLRLALRMYAQFDVNMHSPVELR